MGEWTSEKVARDMRGRNLELGWGEDYPEVYLDGALLEEIKRRGSWVDAEGLTWGWTMMCADHDETGPYIVVASRADGQGYHTQRVWRPEHQAYATVYIT